VTRIRRTAQEARRLILDTAADRLAQFGIKGLNVQGVARDAGISHATLLHHFGSAEGMQQALMSDMTAALVKDILSALDGKSGDDEPDIVRALFQTLAKGGHVKLIAWAAVTDQDFGGDTEALGGTTAQVFAELLDVMVETLGGPRERARRVAYLVASTAVGAGLTSALPRFLGMSDAETVSFPTWLSEQLEKLD